MPKVLDAGLLNLLRFRHELWSYVLQYPALFIPVSRLLMRLGAMRTVSPVKRETEIAIEGSNRSGNHFAVFAFRVAQPRRVSIAHHSHAPAQVIQAVRAGVPTLILIRRPVDVVLSTVIREPLISIRQGFRDWIRFYSRIMPYRDQYVVGTFEQITSDFGEVIKRVNKRYGTDFSPFAHTEENVREVFRIIDEHERQSGGRAGEVGELLETRVARPSTKREEIRASLEKELEAEDIRRLIAKATAVYDEFTRCPY